MRKIEEILELLSHYNDETARKGDYIGPNEAKLALKQAVMKALPRVETTPLKFHPNKQVAWDRGFESAIEETKKSLEELFA